MEIHQLVIPNKPAAQPSCPAELLRQRIMRKQKANVGGCKSVPEMSITCVKPSAETSPAKSVSRYADERQKHFIHHMRQSEKKDRETSEEDYNVYNNNNNNKQLMIKLPRTTCLNESAISPGVRRDSMHEGPIAAYTQKKNTESTIKIRPNKHPRLQYAKRPQYRSQEIVQDSKQVLYNSYLCVLEGSKLDLGPKNERKPRVKSSMNSSRMSKAEIKFCPQMDPCKKRFILKYVMQRPQTSNFARFHKNAAVLRKVIHRKGLSEGDGVKYRGKSTFVRSIQKLSISGKRSLYIKNKEKIYNFSSNLE